MEVCQGRGGKKARIIFHVNNENVRESRSFMNLSALECGQVYGTGT